MMPSITAALCELLIMTAVLIAVWLLGKKEGVDNEKTKTAARRSDAVSRGLRAGSRARDEWLRKHK